MTNKKRAWGVYVHIPYCVKKCAYCDFASASMGGDTAREQEQYAAALRAEIMRTAPPLFARFGDVVTVYFGGGTPTALPAHLLTGIIRAVQAAAGTPAELTGGEPGDGGRGMFCAASCGRREPHQSRRAEL
ncbi:coproporphyrinogen dehydrogenase [Selenomonas sp. oral taxon 137 str. F0430]|nr:coproporphyrinogen dehydrogenase [Selenomonas sp. oral taxon 137 str. F0430]